MVTVWTANVDEKPLAVTVPCQDGAAIFGTLQALIAHAYASAHPDRPALRFWPEGSYVATNAAREPLFHADQKVPLSTLRQHAMPIFFLYDCVPSLSIPRIGSRLCLLLCGCWTHFFSHPMRH